jgi:hypothetical protein
VRLSQAVRKLSKTTVQGYRHSTGVWETLPFKLSYPPDGRFIGRSVDFYDRRIFTSPEEITEDFSILRIGTGNIEELMIYAQQKNIHKDRNYIYSYTGLNIQGRAKLFRNTKTQTASGIGGIISKALIGEFPVMFVKGFSGPAHESAAGVYNSRINGYMPQYAGVLPQDTIELFGESYQIDEVIPELRLTFVQLTKL